MGKETRQETSKEEVDFNGAAILNDDGTETPITEEMVRDACDQLETTDSEVGKPA